MNAIAESLRAEHRNFEHVLQLIYANCRLANIKDPEACRFMTNAVLYLQEFGDGVHNEKVCAVLRKLLAADPSRRELCQRLQDLRERLRETEQGLRQHIAAAHAGSIAACERVKELVEEYRDLYSRYVALEEQEALPAAEAALTEHDWQEIAQRFTKVSDPVFGRDALKAHSTPYDALMALSPAPSH